MCIEHLKNHRDELQEKLKEKEDEIVSWKERCLAAEAAYNAAKEWWEKELSLDGFEALSKTYDRWQQLKQKQ